jgi:hypothetical protein
MLLRLPVLLLTMLVADVDRTGGSVRRDDPCPPNHASADRMVRIFLGNPLLPELSVHSRIGTANLGDIRLLTTEHDREICEALWTVIRANGTELKPADRLAFYRSGDRFFVPIDRSGRNSGPGIWLDGESSLDIYTVEYDLIGRFWA